MRSLWLLKFGNYSLFIWCIHVYHKYMHAWSSCICVPHTHACLMLMEARRHSLNIEYRQLWTTNWVLGTEPVSSARTTALSYWAISPATGKYFFRERQTDREKDGQRQDRETESMKMSLQYNYIYIKYIINYIIYNML